LLLRGIARKKELLSISVGFILGFIPWFYYNFKHQFAGIGWIFEMFGYGNPIDSWATMSHFDKLISFFTEDFPLGMMTPYTLPLPNDLTVIITIIFILFSYLMLIIATITTIRALIHKKISRSHIDGCSDVDEKQK
jgi:hypothetical protein